MDSINYYFQSDNKRDSTFRYMFQAFYMFQNKFWKGRRKDKDSPTPIEEQKEYLEDPNIRNRISDADFFRLVALPPMMDINEWLVTNTTAFFNHVNLIYGVISEYCTAETCSSMTAPDNVQYFWHDDKGRKTKHTAPQYIDYVMTHIQKLINDEAVFPTKYGNPFPADLELTVKRIHRYLFHVLAHIYHAHYKLLRQLNLHAHLNTLFTHFMVFTSKFDLVQGKESDILLLLFSLLLKNLADPNQNPKLREGLGIGDSVLGPPHDKQQHITQNINGDSHELLRKQDNCKQLINGCGNLSHPFCDLVSSSIPDKDSSLRQNGLKQSSQFITSQHFRASIISQPGDLTIERDSSSSASEWLSNLQISAT